MGFVGLGYALGKSECVISFVQNRMKTESVMCPIKRTLLFLTGILPATSVVLC